MTSVLLSRHNRYDYSPLTERKDYSWPGGKRLAFTLTTNIEVYAYRKGTGWDPAKKGEPQQQRNYSWRDYGNRVGIWRMFDLFEQKTQLMRLLDVSSRAEGVRIYIGGESGVVPYEELSIVSAPYEVDGRVVGTLGVIGPTRMAYDRMIQIVDITSKLVSNALSAPR